MMKIWDSMKNARHFQQTLEQALDAVVIIDADNRVTFYNAAAERLWGYSGREVLGQNVKMLVPQMHRGQHDDYIAHHRRTGEDRIVNKSRVVEVERRDGSKVWCRLSLTRYGEGEHTCYSAFVQDITAEREAQEMVEQTLEQALDAVVTIDQDNHVTFFNAAAERLWGRQRSEVLGKNVKMLVPIDVQPHHDAYVQANRSGGADRIVGKSREVRLERADGQVLTVTLSLSRVQLNGRTLYTAFLRDVSAAVAQRDEFKLLSLVANESDSSVIITDALGKVEFVNRGFERLSGYSLAEMLGKKPGDVLQGALTSADAKKRLHEQLLSGQAFTEEIINYRKDGSFYWVSLTINPIKDANGRIERFISIQMDITANKERVIEAEAQQNALDTSMGVAEFTPSGQILRANDTFLRIMGYRSEDVVGRHHSLFMPPEAVREESYRQFWEKLARGEAHSGQIERRASDGHVVWLEGSYQPIIDITGKVAKVYKFVIDITAQKQAIQAVSTGLSALAEGLLTHTIDTELQGEFKTLREAFNDSVVNLQKTVRTVREATDTITIAASEIASGNSNLSARTEQQAANLEETASSMEELTSTVRQNAANAREANQVASEASEVAKRGGQAVGQVVQTMSEINSASRKIVDIITVIDGIAFQTNILALNAAVEAARAGEQGRGFAVVASEVRNLAQRSAAAAKDIKALINDSVNKVDAGARLVSSAGQTIDEVVRAVKRVSDIMAEISSASAEQSSGIEQVNTAINQLDDMTQQNAALVEEAAAAAESLNEQAQMLVQAIAIFKIAPTTAMATKPATPARALPGAGQRATPASIPAPQGEDDWAEF